MFEWILKEGASGLCVGAHARERTGSSACCTLMTLTPTLTLTLTPTLTLTLTLTLFPARAAEDAVVVVPYCGAAVADLSLAAAGGS